MRVREMLVLGALTFSAMACGDSLAPEAGEGRDLDFVLPTVTRELPDSARYRAWDEPLSASDIAKVRGLQQANAVEGSPDVDGGGTGGTSGGGTGTEGGGTGTEGGSGERLVPVISSHFAIGYFDGDVVKMQYGFFGAGTGYMITPTLKVYGANGVVLPIENSAGPSEDAPIYWYMHPKFESQILVPSWCGAVAQLRVKFEVRVALPMLAERSVGKTQAGDDPIFAQAKCTPEPDLPADGGGGGVGSEAKDPAAGGDEYYLCFFEVWTNQDGIVIEKKLIGCTRVGGEFLRV